MTIRLYEDFQCTACGQFARETLPEAVERHVDPGEAKLVSETLAFIGPDSVYAAHAAFAAGKQGRYWQYAALLFENQGAENSGYVTDEFLTRQAEEVEGLDMVRWQRERKKSYDEELASVQQWADEAGVNSTPTLVVSGPGGDDQGRGADRGRRSGGGGGREMMDVREGHRGMRALLAALVVGVHLANRHHPAHLVEAAVEAFGGLDALLYMARATAPPLRGLDVDAWERSLDVNVRGFVYCLAAALPAMRERGAGHVVVSHVEDVGRAPDPRLRAWRAAVSTMLEEIHG